MMSTYNRVSFFFSCDREPLETIDGSGWKKSARRADGADNDFDFEGRRHGREPRGRLARGLALRAVDCWFNESESFPFCRGKD